MIFHWSLSDIKSPQISRTLLSILADLSNVVVWMASICPLISEFYCPFTDFWRIISRAPTTIGINVTFMFHILFSSLARSWYLSLLSSSFNFTLWSANTAKSTIWQVLFFCWLQLGLVIWARLGDLFVSQNPREAYPYHSPGQILCCAFTVCSHGQI